MASQSIFHVPIRTGGKFICTSPVPRVYLVEFTSPPDNRLTASFCDAFLHILDLIEAKLSRGVIVTTSTIEKFYSNGLDLDDLGDAGRRSTFFSRSIFPLWARLLTYPMPTVALLNGHTFAGGLITALHHDYRIQNPVKGFLCMNEVHFGATMDPGLLGIFKTKVPSPATFRSLILEGHRFTAQQALREGLVDALGGREEAMKFIQDRELVKKGDSGVLAGLKEEMYKDQLAALSSTQTSAEWHAALGAKLQNRSEERERRIETASSKAGESKL